MNACCEDVGNRLEGPGPRGLPDGESADDVVITHCSVCECRHFEVDVEPIKLGLKGSDI